MREETLYLDTHDSVFEAVSISFESASNYLVSYLNRSRITVRKDIPFGALLSPEASALSTFRSFLFRSLRDSCACEALSALMHNEINANQFTNLNKIGSIIHFMHMSQNSTILHLANLQKCLWMFDQGVVWNEALLQTFGDIKSARDALVHAHDRNMGLYNKTPIDEQVFGQFAGGNGCSYSYMDERGNEEKIVFNPERFSALVDNVARLS